MSDSGCIEETIFVEARQLSRPEERAAYLKKACGDEQALRERVERMLDAEQKADQFLAANPFQFDQSPASPAGGSEGVGSMIGRYKLLQQIGEGGCGIVYIAEQEQPIRRRVALKVIKPGMDTRQVIARFEAERQALAMMDHPNIARVLDAGTTETGRPYFIMELVRGIRITEYCDQNNLSTRERLDLFIKVVQAVQHAHQKGIIHRDLKPSNVLITLHDGVPVPKVIDFGIAKALEQKLTDKTLFTQFEQFIGTPAYTSPEQAEMSGLDIDTRSDIYSLGVLLYELLVGKTPFDAQDLVHSGLDEMRRIIREKEPARPSTRLSTMLQGEITTTAQHRRISAPELIHLLKGDLDWVVMKCLEKDRTRRYETANGLAGDIQRYLNNEPVTACPPSNLYRFSKLVRRNKLAFAASAAVAMALVIGIVASTWQAARARRAEQAAQSEKASAQAVLKFFEDNVLAAGRPQGKDGGLGKDVTLRQAVDAAESEIAKAFQDRPVVEASIRQKLGESYLYLGEPVLAVRQSERALALHRANGGLEHPDTLEAMGSLAGAYLQAGKYDQAVPLFEETLRLKKARLGPKHPDTLGSMNDLGWAYYRQHRKREEIVPLLEEALKLMKATLGPEHPQTLRTMSNLAEVYRGFTNLALAVQLSQETLQLMKANLGPEHPDTLEAMQYLAGINLNMGRTHQTLPLLDDTFRLTKAKLGPQHPKTLSRMTVLTAAYAQAGKHDLALALGEETVTLKKAKLGLDHPSTLQSMDFLAARMLQYWARPDTSNPAQARERAEEIEQFLRDYLAAARIRHTNNPVKMEKYLYEVAELRYLQHQYADAQPLYQELLNSQRARFGAEHDKTIPTMASLGRLLGDWAWAERDSKPEIQNPKSEIANRAREAERVLRDCLVLCLHGTNITPWRLERFENVKSRLGGALVSVAVTDPSLDSAAREAKLAEAETLLLEGNQRLQESKTADKYKRDALERLTRLYEAWGKPDKLSQWQQKLEAFDKAKAKSSQLAEQESQ